MEKSKLDIIQVPLFLMLSAGCLLPIVNTPIALAAGLAFGIFLGCPSKARVSKYTKMLLQVSVVGLGFGIPIVEVLHAGRDGLWLSFITIALALGIGALLARWLKVRSNTGTLISVGTAICGGSAIAAIAPIVHADSDEISVSMGAVFSLNALALFLFPWIGQHLLLTPEQFGLWSALAIHDTSSVVGASSLFGPKALAIATTVKLSRALWILPLSVFYALLSRAKGKITIPWFIFFFIAAAAINSAFPGQVLFGKLSVLAKQALCLVLFWIGSTMNKESLAKVGWRPFVLAISLWVLLASISLCYLKS